MSAPSLPLLALLLLTAPVKTPRFEQGRVLFTQGDFDGALKALDGAAQETQDPQVLVKVHLLRGQCFAARQEFSQAEEAFQLALSADPEAALDPARVDPTVVKVLDSVRARLTGVLLVTSTPPGATVEVDGRRQGKTPLAATVGIGKHRVEAAFEGGEVTTEVMVYPRHETRAVFARVATGSAGKGSAAEPASRRELVPLAEVRAVGELPADARYPWTWGLEFGGGFEWGPFRLGATARLFPSFGLVPRGAVLLPLTERVVLCVEAAIPVWFRNGGIATGLGASLGVEYLPLRALGVFAQVGGEQLLLNPQRVDSTHFLASAGVRLRVP